MVVFQNKGGSIYVSSKTTLQGNDVYQRSLTFPNGGQRTWLDDSVSLTKGRLRKFYVYIAGNLNFQGQNTNVRLQIWRPNNNGMNTYRLVWEQRLFVLASYPTGYMYTVKL